MITLIGGSAGVAVEIDRDVSYTEIETALRAQAGPKMRYSIDLQPMGDRTMVHLNAFLPLDAITGSGVPTREAAPVLRALAGALEALDRAAT